MASGTRHLTVVRGGATDPLRAGTCRRPGCAETVTELGLCADHFRRYTRLRGRREQALARGAAANFDVLVARAGSTLDEAGRPVEREWLWALGEHLAAHGVDAGTAHDEDLLRQAVLDALGDYVDEQAGRGHLTVVA